MDITINGKLESIQPCSLRALVHTKGLKTDALVVEYNQRIVKQAHWDDIQLQEHDTLEFLSFVGGG